MPTRQQLVECESPVRNLKNTQFVPGLDGYPLSPILFNCAFDWTTSNAVIGYWDVQLNYAVHVLDPEFADDVVLADSPIRFAVNSL